MKKNYILLSLTFILGAITLQAQQVHPCGTEPHHTEWFKNHTRNQTAAYRGSGADTMLYVPMTIHIVGTDNGSGYISYMQLLDGFCGLNNDYASSDANIQFFFNGDFRYIDSTAWYNHDSLSVGYDMMIQNDVANSMNTYIVSNPAGNAGYNLPSANMAMRKGYVNANAHTWAHEIGHNCSVQHPFLGWEGKTYDYNIPTPTTVTYDYTGFKKVFHNPNDTTIIDTAFVELVDGSNCAFAADRICDTPPDYLSYGGWQCDANGQSTTLLKDPNNVDFRADATNIMTYANDACGAKFTPGQIAVIRANLLTEKSSYLNHQNMTVDTIPSMNLITPAPNDVVDHQSVSFTWDRAAGATHYVFQTSFVTSFSALHSEILTSDTTVTVANFINNRKYYWRVRPFNQAYTCAPVSPAVTFETADLTLTQELKSVEKYRIYPNLITANQAINIDLTLSQNLNADILIVAANGQIVRKEHADFSTGDNQIQIQTNALAAGIYVLAIQTKEGIIRDKFVVVK